MTHTGKAKAIIYSKRFCPKEIEADLQDFDWLLKMAKTHETSVDVGRKAIAEYLGGLKPKPRMIAEEVYKIDLFDSSRKILCQLLMNAEANVCC